ncbi:MAG: hypothetical protein J1F03_05980 [Oscillospiraceae bacterium]|nr:hypothetical protein [Oscillospiraceae bacterium]
MEDMKKMIERYKRELLEYSKAGAHEAQTAESVSDRPSDSQYTDMSVGRPSSERKKPSVIGYISENAQKELENMNVPEEIIESVYPKASEVNDTAVSPSEDNETVTYTIPADSADVSNSAADAPINSETKPPISDNDAQNAPADEASNDDETFDRPMFSEIPSFDETREQITEESVPNENYPTQNTSGVTDNSTNTSKADFGNNETVSNEQAERLTEQPISGTDPDEQLTGRNFEDMRTPQNDPDDAMQQNGSQTKPSEFPKPVYDTIEEFEANNLGRGTILFRVYTAREALPVRGAICRITKTFDGKPYTFYTLVTDENGQTPPKPLPAPSKALSQNFENKIQPFALYDAVVSRDGYADVEFKEIPIFDGVSSVQQVGMVPVPRINIKREGDADAR